MVLGRVFVVEVVEGMKLVLGCVVRLVLWCVNGRGYFLYCFSLILVEMNGLSVGGYLFGMVIWVNYFLLLEHDFFGRMVGTDMMMKVVVEVVVVEAVDVVQASILVFSRRDCLGNMMDLKMVRVCGWCGGVGGVGVLEVVCGVIMGVVVGGVGTRGEGVVSSGGNVSVADGRGARWKDCCRFPNGISRELWEDLPYHLQFMLNISDVFL